MMLVGGDSEREITPADHGQYPRRHYCGLLYWLLDGSGGDRDRCGRLDIWIPGGSEFQDLGERVGVDT
jgi:hypothetical protein